MKLISKLNLSLPFYHTTHSGVNNPSSALLLT